MSDEAQEVQTVCSARERVERLEAAMMGIPQTDCPVRHHFAPGVYAREITIPKDTVLVGVVHKRDNLVVLSAGRLRLVTDDGAVEISAPHTHLCKAGTKNAAVALEDSVWTNFFATDETDTDKLVELLTESTAAELLGGSKNKQLAANRAAAISQE
ncbi:hypothetical protein [Acidovorax sp. FHTAMBA]|jgi:hypothetical protein|uniref:hypothetical protein n=1 Tax=Acidovorax sp. FHTAMBA TaxID=3140252 RepID=UPI0031840880